MFECSAIGSGTINRCGLLEEYVTVGAGFEVLYAQAMPSVTHSLLLPADQDVELLIPSPGPCWLECCCASLCDDNGPNL